MIEKYKNHPYCLAHDKLIPVNSNFRYNTYLKELADLCDISITYNAEEQYIRLAQTQPPIIERVPQNLIVSYLGLAPETLSRIKKNLAFKNGD